MKGTSSELKIHVSPVSRLDAETDLVTTRQHHLEEHRILLTGGLNVNVVKNS